MRTGELSSGRRDSAVVTVGARLDRAGTSPIEASVRSLRTASMTQRPQGVRFVSMITRPGNGGSYDSRPASGRIIQLVPRQPLGVRDSLRPIRRPPDYFARLDRTADAFPADERTFRAARALAEPIGDADVDEPLLRWLAQVPLTDMRAFARRGGRIIFASSFLAAAAGDEADRRRRRPLHPVTLAAYEDFDRTPVFGAYDEELNWIIFTGSARSIDSERLILHEFGHAMTVPLWSRRAHLRADLLLGLPGQIDDVLMQYRQGDDLIAVRERVLEALAEAYAWMCMGRWSELPGRLRSIVWSVAADNAVPQAS